MNKTNIQISSSNRNVSPSSTTSSTSNTPTPIINTPTPTTTSNTPTPTTSNNLLSTNSILNTSFTKSKSFDIGNSINDEILNTNLSSSSINTNNNPIKYNTIQDLNKIKNKSNILNLFKRTNSNDINSNNGDLNDQIQSSLSYYEQWYEYDLKRRELKFNIKNSLQLIKNRFSYKREEGFDHLIQLISNLELNLIDKDMFSLIHKKLEYDTNIIVGMITYLQFNNNYEISPITSNEIYKCLLVIEGCCLISNSCSNSLVSINGIKIILKILSEMKNDQDEIWDEIKLTCLDTIQSCLHNCNQGVYSFCEDSSSGPDVICSILRNRDCPKLLRSKCVEFFCILFKLLELNENDHYLLQKTSERIKVFLGNVLTKNLLELWKDLNDNNIDVIKCDEFIDLIDERF